MASPRFLFLLVLVLALPGNILAQGLELRGAVRDSGNRPIPEVEVVLRESSARAVTDAAGRFAFTRLSSDSAHLSLRRVGYKPLAVAVTLQGDGLPALSLVMSPEAYLLPEVKTTARMTKPIKYLATVKYDAFFRRMKLGIGTFVTREQIESMNAFHSLEILRGIPGVKVDVGAPGDFRTADIRMARCQEGSSGALGKVTVAIDGVMLLGGSGLERGLHGQGSFALAEKLGRIAAPDIELVEIYRGPGEIPAEFYEPNACGAIAIWTRYGRGPASTPKRKPGE